jgi:hypothetical protein
VLFTATITSTYGGGLFVVGATTTTYVLVNSPTAAPVLSTSLRTRGNSRFKSTVTGATETYVLVNVPTA